MKVKVLKLKKTYYVYIIECVNGSFYTGYTTDIKRRYREHTKGIKCNYTKAFPPLRLLACWQTVSESKSPALKLECAIKKLSKARKIKLANNPIDLVDFFEGFDNFIVYG